MIDILIKPTLTKHPGREEYKSDKWDTRTYGDFGNVRATRAYQTNPLGRHPFNIITKEILND